MNLKVKACRSSWQENCILLMQGFDCEDFNMAIIDIEYGREILEQSVPEQVQDRLQEMEMVMQNSSYGHEYALLELKDVDCRLRHDELTEQIDEYKSAYFQARQYLSEHHPDRLADLERELVENKVKVFQNYHA